MLPDVVKTLSGAAITLISHRSDHGHVWALVAFINET